MKPLCSPLRRYTFTLCLAACAMASGSGLGQPVISSLSQNGELVCTNLAPDMLATVEWSSSVTAPWTNTWVGLDAMAVGSNGTIRVSVPMFYRVRSYPPSSPTVTDVTAAAGLALVTSHRGDPDFVVLDVRTPSEYSPRHVMAALNVNFNSTAFEETLAKLDRKKTYLVYCASGNRSRQAVEVMRRLRFMQVYSMTEGFGALAALAGAGPHLEP